MPSWIILEFFVLFHFESFQISNVLDLQCMNAKLMRPLTVLNEIFPLVGYARLLDLNRVSS